MEFIHCQYLNEAQPQKICLFIGGETKDYYIDYWADLGSATPIDIHFDRELALELPSFVYSENEAEEILKDLESDIKKLLDSYSSSRDDDNTLCGYWNDELIEEIKNKLANYKSKYELYDASEWYSLEDKNELKEELINNGIDATMDKILDECASNSYYVNPRQLQSYFENLIEQ